MDFRPGRDHAAVSSHRNEDVGPNYGLLVKEWRELPRSVFVFDPRGRMAHAEYVAAISRLAG